MCNPNEATTALQTQVFRTRSLSLVIVLGLSLFVAYILNTVTACLNVSATSKAGASSGIIRDSGNSRTMYKMAATNTSVTYLDNTNGVCKTYHLKKRSMHWIQ